MDLQAAETAHKTESKDQFVKKLWSCPCSGCKKAVKQERLRITEEVNLINLDNLNAEEAKTLILGVVNGTSN